MSFPFILMYIDLAQLLLDSHPAPEEQAVVTECARVFETMNIRTAAKEAPADDQG